MGQSFGTTEVDALSQNRIQTARVTARPKSCPFTKLNRELIIGYHRQIWIESTAWRLARIQRFDTQPPSYLSSVDWIA